jgi:methionine-S-sulfoxide reductase
MEYKKAVFAGGCFWCMEPPFKDLEGVIEALPGYTGGVTANPTYEQVCKGNTGHYEAVEVTYDPKTISYERLLEAYWRLIDPTDPNGQFADRGRQYQTAIFYNDEAERQAALKSKQKLEASGKFGQAIETKILRASEFYPAEEYHCRYYQKNPQHYTSYKKASGRETYLHKTWGDKNEKGSE